MNYKLIGCTSFINVVIRFLFLGISANIYISVYIHIYIYI